MPRITPMTGLTAAWFAMASATAVSHAGDDLTNLLTNGDFASGTTGWMAIADVTHQTTGGPAGDDAYVAMTSDQVTDTSLTQTLTGLQPMNRYTVCAKVRTDSNNLPPTLTINGDIQRLKSKGYIDPVEVNEWVEWRYEFFVDDAASPSVDVQLICPRTTGPGITPAIDFADLRLYFGRLADAPPLEPWRAAWTQPPSIIITPGTGNQIVLNGGFDQGDTGGESWNLFQCAIVDDGGTPALKATPTEINTAVAAQAILLSLPPQESWTISVWGKADEGVTGSMSLEGENLAGTTSVSINSTSWTQFSFTVETGDSWVNSPNLKLSCYKDQVGSAWFRDVTWVANGDEWTATTANPPVPQTTTFTDDFSGGLSLDDWLVSNKGWGGDNGGVWWQNVSIVDDTDNGEPIKALKLTGHGDNYTGPIVTAGGAKTRVGAAIATRQYFSSARYTVRAKLAPDLGACTAFWPFNYIEYQNAQLPYWHESNPRRNTEIDWEFPTDLVGNEGAGDPYGIDGSYIAFTNVRTNAWGGQFGGEGGEHKGRSVINDGAGNAIDMAVEANDGNYHDFMFEWRSGEDNGDNAVTRVTQGTIKWYIDGVLIDELTGPTFGQGNVPYRGARFWLGVWFPHVADGSTYGQHGYGGWAGTPAFDTTACYIASVTIEPFNDPRDVWVSETVPNLAWATPDEYPDGTGGAKCTGDITGVGEVGIDALNALLSNWLGAGETDINEDGITNILDLIMLLKLWGACP
jgi:hypothetical protein